MRAVLGACETNARNLGGEKETVDTMKLVARVNGRLQVVCDARFYMGRSSNASTVQCALWVHGANNYHTSGKGTAGGWGYHKLSSALGQAIRNADIKLYGCPYGANPNDTDREAHIDGVGEDAMRGALLAIAMAAGADTTEYLFV